LPRKPRRHEAEWQSYYGDIVDWEVDYSLMVGRFGRPPQPYHEHLTLNVSLRLLFPPKLAGEVVAMQILGRRGEDRELDAEQHGEFLPLVVGTLTVRGREKSYLGSLPYTAIMGLLPVLESRRIRMITLHGKKLYRGEAQITSMGLVRQVDPDDWG
jgi:hypothetical protein